MSNTHAKFSNPNRIKELEERARKRKAGLIKASYVDVRVLSAKQHHAISLLSDFINCWGWDYICGQVGIPFSTLKNWRNDPLFLKELDKEITRRRTTFRLEAHRLLFKKIKKGNPRLLLSYLKMTGDLTDKVQWEDVTKSKDELSDDELDTQIQKLEDELGISAKRG